MFMENANGLEQKTVPRETELELAVGIKNE